MKLLKIPEELWDGIATAEEQEAKDYSLIPQEDLPSLGQSRNISDIKLMCLH